MLRGDEVREESAQMRDICLWRARQYTRCYTAILQARTRCGVAGERARQRDDGRRVMAVCLHTCARRVMRDISILGNARQDMLPRYNRRRLRYAALWRQRGTVQRRHRYGALYARERRGAKRRQEEMRVMRFFRCVRTLSTHTHNNTHNNNTTHTQHTTQYTQ